ncbi:MAG: 50S ribosomal protein L18, partial [Myxococcaceae bacterium]
MANTEARIKRKNRIRRKLSGTAARPRLTVYKSLKHIYAQVVDDASGRTLAFASSLSKELKGQDEGDKKEDA